MESRPDAGAPAAPREEERDQRPDELEAVDDMVLREEHLTDAGLDSIPRPFWRGCR